MTRSWRGPTQKKRKGRKWIARGREAHEIGQRLEDKVEGILKDMMRKQLIDSFIRHKPRTPKKDFTITRNGVRRKVNVTTSDEAWKDHYNRFGQEVEIIYFPLTVQDEEILNRILQIFDY